MTGWRKSTRSGNDGACVEVNDEAAAAVRVRDSKDRGGPVLAFDPQVWQAFIDAVKTRRL